MSTIPASPGSEVIAEMREYAQPDANGYRSAVQDRVKSWADRLEQQEAALRALIKDWRHIADLRHRDAARDAAVRLDICADELAAVVGASPAPEKG
jgi:hypothetical protein